MEGNDESMLDSQLYLLLFILGSAAIILAVYHFIRVTCFNRRRRLPINLRNQPMLVAGGGGAPSNAGSSLFELIPAHKHKKSLGMVGEDCTCAVCLCEFEEGDELRTLPQCLHSFHAPCIDMWFYSHSSCPVCRTDATPSQQVLQCLSSHGPASSPFREIV
ncbi:hypothetical protein NMG60_11012477 [Bertholletia excelsa]